MMKKILVLIVCCVIFSCNEKLIKAPENLIEKEAMIDILYDIAVITAAKSISIEVLRRNNIETMDYIYTKYGIDSIQFVASDTYYASRPEEYLEIYTVVESRLNEEKQEWEDKKKLQEERDKKENEKMRNKVKASDTTTAN